MEEHKSSCNLILNTITCAHDVNHYLNLLKYSGTIVQLGVVAQPHQVSQISLFRFRKSISGSHVGGIPATNEVLELCAKAGVLPDCKMVTAN
jgi:uncharacterized zinc-type alcohol dehydrogenase-like protein